MSPQQTTGPVPSPGPDRASGAPEPGYGTYIVAVPDLAGRLVGKRLDPGYYHSQAISGIRTCDVVFGWGVGHELLDGFDTVGWQHGYGDFLAIPDPSTLRPLHWWPDTALAIGDAVRDDGQPVAIAPRHVLAGQVRRAAALGLAAMIASELEFTVFDETPASLEEKSYTRLLPHGRQLHPELVESTGSDEELFSEIRRALVASGIAVEYIKAEYSLGQFELVISAAEALTAADDHAVYKLGLREMCRRAGLSASFMAKWDDRHGGSGCHLHVSLRDDDGRNLFAEGDDTKLRHFIGGLQRHAADVFLLWAPYPNSYKRFRPGSFAPFSLAWGADNRTTALRVTGRGGGRHLENRIPGADINPYLAYTGLLAAGLTGIEQRIEPDCGIDRDNAYSRAGLPPLPRTLDESIDAFTASQFTREHLGDVVVDHIANFAAQERDAARGAVTNWDRRRLFDI